MHFLNGICLVLVIPVLRVIPVEPLLVEFDDNLRDLCVGFFGGNKVRLVWALPLDQEEKLARIIRSSDDPLCCETSCETSGLVLIFFLLLLFLGLILSSSLGFPFVPSFSLNFMKRLKTGSIYLTFSIISKGDLSLGFIGVLGLYRGTHIRWIPFH